MLVVNVQVPGQRGEWTISNREFEVDAEDIVGVIESTIRRTGPLGVIDKLNTFSAADHITKASAETQRINGISIKTIHRLHIHYAIP